MEQLLQIGDRALPARLAAIVGDIEDAAKIIGARL